MNENYPGKQRQLISPRESQLVYTEQQPVDELTGPVDDPCGTKCKGGGCNSAVSFPEEADLTLVF